MENDKPALSLAAVPGRRKRTLELAREIETRGYPGIYCPSIGDGMIFANGVRSHMAKSLATLPQGVTETSTFFIGNMIPTCIDDDLDTARAVNRKTLSRYALLPNYRNYWKDAGYAEEMVAVEPNLSRLP